MYKLSVPRSRSHRSHRIPHGSPRFIFHTPITQTSASSLNLMMRRALSSTLLRIRSAHAPSRVHVYQCSIFEPHRFPARYTHAYSERSSHSSRSRPLARAQVVNITAHYECVHDLHKYTRDAPLDSLALARRRGVHRVCFSGSGDLTIPYRSSQSKRKLN